MMKALFLIGYVIAYVALLFTENSTVIDKPFSFNCGMIFGIAVSVIAAICDGII